MIRRPADLASIASRFLDEMPFTSESKAAHWRSYLKEFLAFCDSAGVSSTGELGPDVYAAYAEAISATSGRRTLAEKLMTLRKMCRYAASIGVACIEPVIPSCPDDFAPYIYSEREVEEIMRDADSFEGYRPWRNRWISQEYPIILRLLHSCGLRAGEAVSLRYGDVDWESGVLAIKQAKGNKDRLVPMHEGMASILGLYWSRMGFPSVASQPLFPGKSLSQPLSVKGLYSRFRFGRERTGINVMGRKGHERGACVHSLRHTFAMGSFRKAVSSGLDPMTEAPFLSAYMGHASVEETEKYLKFDWDLFPESLVGFDEAADRLVGAMEDEEE